MPGASSLTAIARFAALTDAELAVAHDDARRAVEAFFDALEAGTVRAAYPSPSGWRVEPVVKQGILLGFKLGRLVSMGDDAFRFVDKDTFPIRQVAPQHRIRLVPGGSAIRRGAFVAPAVTIMPPAYINVGAYVDEGTLVDSHALVGSCAQVGKRVHVSAAAQIGGVLEPIGAVPVVVEDDAFLGGNVGVYEGTQVGRRAVIAAGVVLTSSTKVADLVHARMIVAGDGNPLCIPEGAVVVPGSRPAKGDFARQLGLHIATPLIVKYRDESTDAKAALEDVLRS